MIRNKYALLFVVVFFSTFNISFAQSYTITPNDTIQKVGMLEDLETLSIQQLNTSANTISLRWKKASESVPSNWGASNCDNRICNTTLVDSGMMNPVIPNDYGLLLLHITPHVNIGTAIIRYAVWDIANPALKDTLTYILTVNNTSGIEVKGKKTNFVLFPNPANDFISIISNIETEFTFLLTDLSGKKIFARISKEKSLLVSSEDFPNGIYILSIFDKNKNPNTKKIIIQH